MSSSDQFALWLNNRHLFNELNDDTLKLKQNEIIKFFGGFRAMINTCLCQQFTIDLPTHQQLFTLLDTFANEQRIKLAEKSIENKQIIKKQESNLLNVCDIGISIIFNFLDQDDHISFQKVCKTLTVIGRRKESCDEEHDDILYKLAFQHKLSYITNCIESNNRDDWFKAINMTRAVVDLDEDATNAIIVRHSCIIPSLLALSRKSMTNNPDVSADILHLLYNNVLTTDTMCIFTKYNFHQLLGEIISNCNGNLMKKSLLILNYMHDRMSNQILLNNINFTTVLVNNIKKCDSGDLSKILPVIGNLIAHSNFDCDKNVNIISKLVNIELFECIKKYVETAKEWEIDQHELIINEDEYEKWTHNNHIVNLYEKINKKYDIEFNIYDKEKMSLILFLLKHTNVSIYSWNTIDKWLDIDIALLIDKNILQYIIQKCSKLKCFEIYLKLLERINECPATIERQESFETLKNYFFSESNEISEMEYLTQMKKCLTRHFDAKNNINHGIDFMEEFINLYRKNLCCVFSDLHSFLSKLQTSVIHFLINNDTFGRIMIDELNKNTKRTLKLILKAVELDGFILIINQNKYKIFKSIINCCYSRYNILAIKCCLKCSDTSSHANQQYNPLVYANWRNNGIIYALQDFMVKINASDEQYKQKHSTLIIRVIDKLDNYIDVNNWMVEQQLLPVSLLAHQIIKCPSKSAPISNIPQIKEVPELNKLTDCFYNINNNI